MKFLNKYGYDLKIKQIVQLLVICIIFPYTVNYLLYYGFVSNYSFNIYSEQGFRQHFENGLYKYRVLGREAVLKTYDVLKQNKSEVKEKDKFITFLDPEGDKLFYRSIFLVNTIFYILTAIVFFLVLSNRKLFYFQGNEVVSLTFLALFFMAVTQYVITPYDVMSYFFLSLSFPLAVSLIRSFTILKCLALLGMIILCTLTRESSAIILAMFATLILSEADFNVRRLKNNNLILLSCCVLVFLLVYFSLRLYYGFSDAIIQSDYIFYKKNLLERKSHIGAIFFVASLFIIFSYSQESKKLKMLWVFLLCCSPYLLFCWYTGILFETRLWVPVLLPAIFLSVLDQEKLFLTKYKKPEL